MSWTYLSELLTNQDVDPSIRDLMRVRLELADTDTTEQLLQDEEITYLLNQESEFWGAVARGAEMIARIFARQADEIANPTVKLSFRERVRHYQEMAATLRKRASGGRAPLFVSGSMATKQAQRQDTDRTGPYFRRGMHDRFAGEDTPNPFPTGTDPLFQSPPSP
jgi:hypothetical protein